MTTPSLPATMCTREDCLDAPHEWPTPHRFPPHVFDGRRFVRLADADKRAYYLNHLRAKIAVYSNPLSEQRVQALVHGAKPHPDDLMRLAVERYKRDGDVRFLRKAMNTLVQIDRDGST